MATVPPSLVQYFLLGRVSSGELQRFTQDAGVVADVWLSFAEDLKLPRRILLAPIDGIPAMDVAAVVHEALALYRARRISEPLERRPDGLRNVMPEVRRNTNVAPLESFVAVTVYFDELVRVILPLTQWWCVKDLDRISEARGLQSSLTGRLALYIWNRLGEGEESVSRTAFVPDAGSEADRLAEFRVLEASYIIALIGLFVAVSEDPAILTGPMDDRHVGGWAARYATTISEAAVRELAWPLRGELTRAMALLPQPKKALIQRVFLNRECLLADTEAISTVKADAATRVFDISCESLTWCVIDSGIAGGHRAFDEFETGEDGAGVRTGRSRVRGTYDLTAIERIRNFDLVTRDAIERSAIIENILKDLRKVPGVRATGFDALARQNLRAIGDQLRRRLLPDWGLIEPLIRIEPDDGASLKSDHGTHVAGILGGDWRVPRTAGPPDAPEEQILRGVCPDIRLYDLRVIHPNLKNTEFAVIAALEFVRYLNSRAAGPPVIHGVNISLSVGSSRVDLQACKLEYSIVSPK